MVDGVRGDPSEHFFVHSIHRSSCQSLGERCKSTLVQDAGCLDVYRCSGVVYRFAIIRITHNLPLLHDDAWTGCFVGGVDSSG